MRLIKTAKSNTASLILVGVGLILCIIALAMNMAEVTNRSRCDMETTAVVAQLVSNSDGALMPVYSFNDASGREYRVSNNIYTSPCKYSEGDKVRLRYSADDPDNFYINGDLGLYLFVYIFGGIGCVLFVVGGRVLLSALLRSR